MKPSHLRPALLHEPSEAEIQKAAYHLWLDGGCQKGVELDNWLAAKELLKHRHGHAHGHLLRGSHQPAPRQFPSPSQP